jgi:soluble lytic murein transglycosylase-like protein
VKSEKMLDIAFIIVALMLVFGMIYSARPKPLPAPIKQEISPAVVDVAKVFGRSNSNSCRNADSDFINLVADNSLKAGVKPSLVAGVIDQESGCDQFAISQRGAAGEMQIMLKVWQSKFDFSQHNPFNKEDNIKMGCSILADLVNQYGEKEALRRYQGVGVNGDPNYVSEVTKKEKP